MTLKDEADRPTRRLTLGGAPIAESIRRTSYTKHIYLTDADKTFIKYVEMIPLRADITVTHKRPNVVTVAWSRENEYTGAARGRAAFFDVGPWIIGKLTNTVDANVETTL